MEENKNLETTELRGRPRNRWQDEVREDGGLVDGKGWKERVFNREEWKKLLRTAKNRSFSTCQWNEMNVWIIQASHNHKVASTESYVMSA